MVVKDLTPRRDNILGLIIDTHIATAAPIASRTISKKLKLALSPASIRNVMADLEEMGLITHPHTSAGRIPTEKGYRYYINKLMEAKFLTEEEKRSINKEFKAKVNDIDDLLKKVSRILSSITRETGIVLFPVLHKSIFRHAELVRLGPKRLLAVLMTDSGLAEDFVIDIDEDISEQDLGRISNFINNQMNKGPLNKIHKDIMQRLLVERDSFFYVLDKTRCIIDTMLDMIDEDRLYLDGRAYLVEQPEFNDIKRLKNLFKLLEDDEVIPSLLERDLEEDGVKVHIGSELGDHFKGYSIITSNYCIGNAICGTLGIIGPMRMDYAKFISAVDYIAVALSKLLSER